jgi:hypothetical protein
MHFAERSFRLFLLKSVERKILMLEHSLLVNPGEPEMHQIYIVK